MQRFFLLLLFINAFVSAQDNIVSACADSSVFMEEAQKISTPKNTQDSLHIFRSYYADSSVQEIYTWFSDKRGKRQRHGLWRYCRSNGTLSSERLYVNGRKNGFSRIYHESGALAIEFIYKNNLLHGKERHWHLNGQLKKEVLLKWNRESGLEKRWDKQGHLIRQVHWNQGKKHGVDEEWNALGLLTRSRHFYRGQLHGLELHWHNEKTLAFKGRYSRDLAHGWHREWDVNGVLRYKALFKQGELIEEKYFLTADSLFKEMSQMPEQQDSSALAISPDSLAAPAPRITHLPLEGEGVQREYDADSVLISESEYKNGKRHGRHQLWRRGTLFVSLEFKEGVLHGQSCMYYANGQARECIPYVDGKIQGEVLTWFTDGLPKGKYKYRNSKRIGKAEGWWRNGKLRFSLSYIGNQKNGSQKTWHQNGKLHEVSYWILGEREGVQQIWKADGSLQVEATFSSGQCQSGDCALFDEGENDPFEVE
jgi:antitoxin component YwqK of YwqJK toxin-antitoxin module